MKKWLKKTVIVAALLALVTVPLTACSGGSDGGSPAKDDKVYELNVNLPFAEGNGPGVLEAVKNCEERSGGRLSFTIYWSNSLLNIREMPKGYADGIADVGPVPMNLYTDQLPLNSVIASQPFLGYESRQQAWDIYNQIHEEFPEMNQEIIDLGMTPVAYYPMAAYYLHMVDKDSEVRVPADLKGMKIITSKLEISQYLSDISAAPVDQPITEFYSSLEKGVANGLWNNWAILEGMKLVPLLHQHINFGATGSHLDFNVYVIRTETLNSLPDDLKTIMLEEWTKAAAAQAVTEQESADRTYTDAQAQGDLFVELTPDEVSQWADPIQPINEAKIAEMAEGNPVAQDIYDRIQELVK
jgi:TRAP-type C4-dicarboxylate transport system substrate-binding protein